ncbi:MAG TPA: hypothetical protein VFZ64_16035 [Nocardioidaceae bacterium]
MIMTSFVVQVSGSLPPHALDRDGSVHRHTVLQATVRDQAALYGFLKVLNDLGLDLLDLRQLPGPDEARTDQLPDLGTASAVEVVIRGSIGDLAMTALSDHVEVTHVATRLLLSDRAMLDQVLDWARDAGAGVEYAVDAPPPTSPTDTPPASRRTASPTSPAGGEAPAESVQKPRGEHRDHGASTPTRRPLT